jgi:hypothetical protein
LGYITELAISIHSEKEGNNTKIAANTNILKELNYSPKPAILIEWFCKRLLLIMYLVIILRNARGTRTGIPDQNMQVMIIIR